MPVVVRLDYEGAALAFFDGHPASTLSDLVQHAGRDKTQIARIVMLLLERGLLAGAPDPADVRSQLLTLTWQGRAVQRGMGQHRSRHEAELLACLSDAQRQQLIDTLYRMLAAAVAADEKSPF